VTAIRAEEQPLAPARRRRLHLDNAAKYVFVLPGIIWVLIFTLFPLLYSLRMSVVQSYLGLPERFVGLANYLRAFGDYQFWTALRVTVILVALSVCGSVLLGLLLALLFNQPVRGIRVLRALFTLPLFATPVAIGYLAITIYDQDNGPINALLTSIGLHGIPWLSAPMWAVIAVALVDIWQWTPFCLIVFLAALQGLPEDLYEAARLDTSSRWQIFRGLTLPLIAPTILTVVILRIVETFKIVDIPFSLTQGGPGISTRTYSFFVYVEGLRFNDPGYASALAYLLLVLVLVVATIYFARAREVFD
jgi:multiple sugar transport system permease protein